MKNSLNEKNVTNPRNPNELNLNSEFNKSHTTDNVQINDSMKIKTQTSNLPELDMKANEESDNIHKHFNLSVPNMTEFNIKPEDNSDMFFKYPVNTNEICVFQQINDAILIMAEQQTSDNELEQLALMLKRINKSFFRTDIKLTAHLNDSNSIDNSKSSDSSKQEIRSFYCGKKWYLFFRYHQILYQRFNSVIELCYQNIENCPETEISHSVAEKNSDFLSHLVKFISNRIDSCTFEDNIRKIIGPVSSAFFTFDSLIDRLSNQAFEIVCDPVSLHFLDLFENHLNKYNSTKNSKSNQSSSRDIIELEDVIYETNENLIFNHLKRRDLDNLLYKHNCSSPSSEDLIHIQYPCKDHELGIGIQPQISLFQTKPNIFDRQSIKDHPALKKSRQSKNDLSSKPSTQSAFLLNFIRKINRRTSDVKCRKFFKLQIDFASDTKRLKFVDNTEDLIFRPILKQKRNFNILKNSYNLAKSFPSYIQLKNENEIDITPNSLSTNSKNEDFPQFSEETELNASNIANSSENVSKSALKNDINLLSVNPPSEPPNICSPMSIESKN